jgi:hypothetical protein
MWVCAVQFVIVVEFDVKGRQETRAFEMTF